MQNVNVKFSFLFPDRMVARWPAVIDNSDDLPETALSTCIPTAALLDASLRVSVQDRSRQAAGVHSRGMSEPRRELLANFY